MEQPNPDKQYPYEPSLFLELPIGSVTTIFQNMQRYMSPNDLVNFCLQLPKNVRPQDNGISLHDRCMAQIRREPLDQNVRAREDYGGSRRR